MTQNMHDSGKRQAFDTGAVRDTAEDKPRPALVSPFFTERLAMWSALGAKKYDDRNWEKGMPFSRVMDSLERHILAYKQGDRSEDHLAAIGWNAQAIVHYEEMIARGILPAELDDMPRYKPEPDPAPHYDAANQTLRINREQAEKMTQETLARISRELDALEADAVFTSTAEGDVAYVTGGCAESQGFFGPGRGW
jgi:hypothetical protein